MKLLAAVAVLGLVHAAQRVDSDGRTRRLLGGAGLLAVGIVVVAALW